MTSQNYLDTEYILGYDTNYNRELVDIVKNFSTILEGNYYEIMEVASRQYRHLYKNMTIDVDICIDTNLFNMDMIFQGMRIHDRPNYKLTDKNIDMVEQIKDIVSHRNTLMKQYSVYSFKELQDYVVEQGLQEEVDVNYKMFIVDIQTKHKEDREVMDSLLKTILMNGNDCGVILDIVNNTHYHDEYTISKDIKHLTPILVKHFRESSMLDKEYNIEEDYKIIITGSNMYGNFMAQVLRR